MCEVGDTMELAGWTCQVGCGKEGVPGVYTKIAAYVHWIGETISLTSWAEQGHTRVFL